MPELRTRPRRGFDRQQLSIKTEQQSAVSVEVTPQQKKYAALAGGALILGFCAFGLNVLLTELDPPPQPTRRTTRQPTKKSTRTGRKTGGGRTTHSGGGSSSGGRRTVLAARNIEKVRLAMKEIGELLPRLKSEKTDSQTFKPRMVMFNRLLEALPDGDRRSLFPMITAKAIEELFAQNPTRACALLDKLMLRVRILMR